MAKLLAVKRATVQSWDGKKLHPVLVDGFYRYPPNEVMLLQARRKPKDGPAPTALNPGDTAAAAFQMLNEGATRRELVMQLRCTPEEAQRLWEEWNLDFGQAAARAHRQVHEEKINREVEADRTERERKRTERLERLRLMFH